MGRMQKYCLRKPQKKFFSYVQDIKRGQGGGGVGRGRAIKEKELFLNFHFYFVAKFQRPLREELFLRLPLLFLSFKHLKQKYLYALCSIKAKSTLRFFFSRLQSWFHINGSFTVQSFTENYISIPLLYTDRWANRFRKQAVQTTYKVFRCDIYLSNY